MRIAVQECCNIKEETSEDIISVNDCIFECKRDCPINVSAKSDNPHKFLVALPSKHATL
jgi:hypothetical protein